MTSVSDGSLEWLTMKRVGHVLSYQKSDKYSINNNSSFIAQCAALKTVCLTSILFDKIHNMLLISSF